MPRHSPIPPGEDPQQHPALTGGSVAIISGEKPLYKQHQKGPQGHAALGSVLEHGGFDYEPIGGKYSGVKQPGYIVHLHDDSEVEKLKGIAKRMGQEAIVHSQGGEHQYVYTAGDDEGKATQPSSGVNWFGDKEPDDNYTTIYGPNGEPLGHFSYNIDFEHPLISHGQGPMVDAPEAAKMVLKSAVEAYRDILLDLRKRELEKNGQLGVGVTVAPGVKVKQSVAEALAAAKRKPAAGVKPTVLPTQPTTPVAKPPGATFSQQRATSMSGRAQAIFDRTAKKYEVESKKTSTHGPQGVSDDISAQGMGGPPSAPYNDAIAGGGPIKTQKAEYHPTPNYQSSRDVTSPHPDGSSLSVNRPSHPFSEPVRPTTGGAVTRKNEYERQRSESVRRREREELSTIPWHNSDKGAFRPTPNKPTPTIEEERQRAQKTEKSMKLHDLMKSQIARGNALAKKEEGEALAKGAFSNTVRGAAAAGALALGTMGGAAHAAPTQPVHESPSHIIYRTPPPGAGAAGTDFRPSSLYAEKGPMVSPSEKPPMRAIPGVPAPGVQKMEPLEKPPKSEAQRRAMHAAAAGKSTLGIPKSVGKDFADADKGGKLPEHKKSEESPKDASHGQYIVKNSIFKKTPEMGKGEVSAGGGRIKLDKQEFYIDLGNASDPKKRLRETNPVKEAVVPGGKETGWKTDGPKPKTIERSASGGAISKNPPKAGPDQKNTAENTVVEGKVAAKAAPKNDLIEKAAAAWHKRNPNGGMSKAMPSMAAPKPPQAPGAGSPTLSAKPPTKPPTAAPGGKPMGGFGKALMPFSAQQEAANKAPRGMAPGVGGQVGAEPKPQARPTSDYDPSLYQPKAPVSSGLELAGPTRPPPGTGVTPRAAQPIKPRSPAMLKNVQMLGKAELCKTCGKVHKAGQCG